MLALSKVGFNPLGQFLGDSGDGDQGRESQGKPERLSDVAGRLRSFTGTDMSGNEGPNADGDGRGGGKDSPDDDH